MGHTREIARIKQELAELDEGIEIMDNERNRTSKRALEEARRKLKAKLQCPRK